MILRVQAQILAVTSVAEPRHRGAPQLLEKAGVGFSRSGYRAAVDDLRRLELGELVRTHCGCLRPLAA